MIISKIQDSCIYLFLSLVSFSCLKTLNSELSHFEVRFTGQNSKPREIEDIINIALVTN